MMGFKAFHSAQATIAGIETAHMIRKGQLSEENMPAYKQFMALAGLCFVSESELLLQWLAHNG
jgi:putative transposase